MCNGGEGPLTLTLGLIGNVSILHFFVHIRIAHSPLRQDMVTVEAMQLNATTLADGQMQVREKEILEDALDELLKRYLHLLDRHQMLQQEIGSHLSSGYLSLAQANFSNHNRSRFGQDYYDDRMKASTKVQIEDSSSFITITDSTDQEDRSDPKENLTAVLRASSMDPLKWYGILVPPSLKAAQKIFQSVMKDAIPELASITTDIKEVEIEVRRTRKKMRKLGRT